MLYQSYAAKLAKWKRAFDRVWRFRFVILAVFLAMLAGAAALMGIEGIVHDVSFPETVVYGQSIEPIAEAIFSDVEFEYSKAGEDSWSPETPRLVGEYECRAVGESVVGTRRPGESFKLRILPAPMRVEVDAVSLVYGEPLPFRTDDLQYHDRLTVGGFLAEEGNGQLNVHADPATISVFNEAGEDVTFCYTFEPIDRVIEDILRPITVSTLSESFVYDGTPHANTQIEVTKGALVEGHTIEAEFPEITEVGSVVNRMSELCIRDADGNDVTDRYFITTDFGRLSVTQRQIAVSTVSDTLTYDGKPHRYGEVELVGGELAEGHKIVSENRLTATVVSPVPYRNAPTVKIVDGDGRDVTANYALDTAFGTVEILPRRIAVKTDDASFTYDGAVHTFGNIAITEGELAEGHEFKIEDRLAARFAGEYDDDPTVKIVDGDGEFVTENYTIETSFGKVSVGKRPISVRTETFTAVYDGARHEYGVPVLTGGELVEGELFDEAQLLYAEEAGEYPNAPDLVILDTLNGSIPVTDSYEITTDFGTFTLERRPIYLTTQSAQWVYDGTPHDYNLFEVNGEEEGSGLLQTLGHVIASEPVAQLVDVSSVDNVLRFTITSNGVDVTENYVALTEASEYLTYGTLTITPRPISITTQSAKWIYDGTDHDLSAEESVLSGENIGLAAGQKLVPVEYTLWKDCAFSDGEAAVRENVVRYKVVLIDDESVETTDNYLALNENVTYGTVTIAPRPIYLTTNSNSWIYDADPHSEEGFTLEPYTDGEDASGILPMHRYVSAVNDPKSVTEVHEGEITNEFTVSFSFTLIDGGASVEASNYEVVYRAYGTIAITPRPVSILSDSETFVYDGEGHSVETFSYTSELHIVDGQSLQFTCPTFTEVAESGYNDFTEVSVVDGEGETVDAGNYELGLSSGYVTIAQRPVLFVTISQERVYDGTEHTEVWTPTDGIVSVRENFLALVEGHALQVQSHSEFVDVCEETNIVSYSIVADGVDKTENYELHYEYGTITITPRPIYIRTDTNAWVYDGTPHNDAGFTVEDCVEDGLNGSGIVSLHDAAATVSGYKSVTEVREGEIENEFTVSYTFTVVGTGAPVKASNYEIVYRDWGTIKIEPRPISITTQSAKWVYDGLDHDLSEADTVSEGQDVGLAAGQKLVPVEYTVWKDCELSDGKAVVRENAVRYKVVLIGDESVETTDNYLALNDHVTFGEITIDPRPIYFKTNSAEWVYDGTDHSYEVWENVEGVVLGPQQGEKAEECGLAADEYLQVKSHKRFVNFGDSGENKVEYFISAGEETTSNYAIHYTYGTVTINKRAVEITTDDGTWVYDGTEHSVTDFTYAVSSLELVAGHRLKFIYPRIVNVAESCQNVFSEIEVLDAEENSVAENYILTVHYGFLTITPRPIQITTQSDEWVYDGAEHILNTHAALSVGDGEGLVLDHAAVPVKYKIWKDCTDGKEDNAVTYEIHAGKTDVTANYSITVVNGKIEITPRPLYVTTHTAEWVFDGEVHFDEGYTIAPFVSGKTDGSGLVAGHIEHAAISDHATVTYVTEGTIANVLAITFTYADANGEPIDVKNYDVRIDNGTLTITKRPVLLVTKNHERIYDGTEHDDVWNPTEGIVTVREGYLALVEGHVLQVESHTPHIDVCEAENIVSYFVVADGLGDMTENYELHYEYGTVKITKRPIYIQTKSNAWVYDGTPHSETEFHIEEYVAGVNGSGIVPLHSAVSSVDAAASVTKVREGKVDNVLSVSFTFSVVGTGASVDAGNYEVVYRDWGKVEITPRPIYFKTHSAEWVYDGTEHKEIWENVAGVVLPPQQGENAEECGLAAGEELHVESHPTFIAVVTKGANDVKYSIWRGGDDTTDNYSLIYQVTGEITITPRPIQITTQSDEWVYDGTDHDLHTDYDSEKGSDFGLAADHYLNAESYHSFKNVSDSGVNDVTYSIRDGKGENVTSNYDVTYVKGNVVISRRPVMVTTGTDTWVFDDTAHFLETYSLASPVSGKTDGSGLVANHSEHATFKSHTEVTYVGNGPTANILTIDFTFTDANGDDVTANYDVQPFTYGTLTITPRPIYLTTNSHSWVYDADPHSEEDFSLEPYIGGANGSGILPTHQYVTTVNGAPSVTNVGDGETVNVFTVSFTFAVIGTGAPIDSNNYVVVYSAYGTVAITPRPIYLTTQSAEWVYDGTAHDHNVFDELYAETEGSGLLKTKGQIITSEPIARPKNVSVVDNVLKFKITSNGDDVTENYVALTAASEYLTYGKLTITKRPIYLQTKSRSFVYDGAPHSYNEFDEIGSEGVGTGLLQSLGHEITSESVAQPTNVSSVDNVLHFTIFASGEDVTENYVALTEKSEYLTYGTLTITPRPIYFKTNSAEWVYDGTDHSYEVWENVEGVVLGPQQGEKAEECGLAADEELQVESHTTFIGVVTKGANEVTYSIWRDGDETTSNYTLIYQEKGEVTITPRPITITTQSADWVYDGTEHPVHVDPAYNEGEGFGLVKGHSLNADSYTHFTNVKDSGKNVAAYSIYDGQGENVSANYTISTEYGTVTITPRPLYVTTGSDTWVFDGKPHFSESYVIADAAEDSGLVAGHVSHAQFTKHTEVTYVGEGERSNELTFTLTFTSAGVEIDSENYEVEIVGYGKIKVTPRPVTLHTPTNSWVYDGEGHSDIEHFWLEECVYDDKAGSGVCEWIGYNITPGTTKTIVTTVGGTPRENDVTYNCKFFLQDGNTPIPDENFVVTVVKGVLTITPRPIYIRTKSIGIVYDGKPHSFNEFELIGEETEGSGLLVSLGHKITSEFVTQVKNIGSEDNVLNFKIESPYKDVTNNYVALTEKSEYLTYGKITVTPRPISITTQSGEWVYDGTEHPVCDDPVYDGGEDFGLVKGHSLKAGSHSIFKNVADSGANKVDYSILDENGEDVSTNYTIAPAYGNIVITPRPIYVETHSDDWIYDGTEHENIWNNVEGVVLPPQNGVKEAEYGLAADEELHIAKYTMLIDVVENEDNVVEYTVWSDDGETTSNYTFHYTYGKITIEKRIVSITTQSNEWVYDGQEHSAQGYTYTSELEFAEGQVFSFSSPSVVNVADSCPNIFYGFALTGSDGSVIDLERNYTLTVTPGTLTITPRPITIVSDSAEWVYDEVEHSQPSAHATDPDEEDLLASLGQFIRIDNSTTILDITDELDPSTYFYETVGYVANELLEYGIFGSDGNPVTENYEITVKNEGRLRIKSPVVVYLYSLSKQYDGKPLRYTEGDYEIYQKPAGVAAEDITVQIGASLTDVDALALPQVIEMFECGGTVFYEEEDEVRAADRFDFIAEEEGDLLVVERRKLTVTTGSYAYGRPASDDEQAERSKRFEKISFDPRSLFTEWGGVLRYECTFAVLYEYDISIENTVDLHIYDENGYEVTDFFDITYQYGTLRWLDE